MLQTFVLRCGHNGMTWLGCKRLSAVAHAPSLEELVIDVTGNPVGDRGVEALVGIRWHNRRLRRLELGLRPGSPLACILL